MLAPMLLTEEEIAAHRQTGRAGGVERARRLSPERRVEIALRAARARWGLCMDCGAKMVDCGCDDGGGPCS